MTKRNLLASFVCCLGIAASAAAGDLWVVCAPGLEVFLDGASVGVYESAEVGMKIAGLEAGEHTIRVEKDGVAFDEYPFTLGPARTQIVVVDAPPKIEGEEFGHTVGAIEITSNPRKCTIEFGGRKLSKEQPILLILGVPVGAHDLHFESEGTKLRTRVAVQAAGPAQVRVDFSNQRVAVVDARPDRGDGESADEEGSPRAEPECIEYWIEVMRTTDSKAIEEAQSALKDIGFPEYHQKLITIEDEGALPIYKLRVGPVTRKSETKYPVHLIRQAGFPAPWVLPEECGEQKQPQK